MDDAAHTIDRHSVDPVRIARLVAARRPLTEKLVAAALASPRNLRSLAEPCLELFYLATALDTDAAELAALCDDALAASVAAMRMHGARGGRVAITFRGRVFAVEPPAHGDYEVTEPQWIRTVYLAMLRGNMAALAELRAMRLDDIVRDRRARVEPYALPLARFLQHLEVPTIDHAAELAHARAQIAAVPRTSPHLAYTRALVGPHLAVWASIHTRDPEAYAAALTAALVAHRDHYAARAAAGELDPEGFLSIPLAAIVRVARDHGMPTTIRSPYLVDALGR